MAQQIGVSVFQSIDGVGVIVYFVPDPFVIADKVIEINFQILAFFRPEIYSPIRQGMEYPAKRPDGDPKIQNVPFYEQDVFNQFPFGAFEHIVFNPVDIFTDMRQLPFGEVKQFLADKIKQMSGGHSEAF